jgi:hypothetical protein
MVTDFHTSSTKQLGSRDSSVGIAMSYWLDGRGSIPSRGKSVQTDSGAHPASYPKGILGSSPRGKAAGGEADHSPPSSAEVMNGGAIPPLHNMSSWRGV